MHKNEPDVRHILEVYGDALYRSAYLLLGNPHDVQDVLQEVLLRFLEIAPAAWQRSLEACVIRVGNKSRIIL